MKSDFRGFPAGFNYFGPQIRLPRKHQYIAGWKRLETLQFGQTITNFSSEQVLFNRISGLSRPFKCI